MYIKNKQKVIPKVLFRLSVLALLMLLNVPLKAQQLVNVTVKVTETFNNYDCCNDAAGICGFTNDFPEPVWKIRVRPNSTPTFAPTATIFSSTCGTRTWDRTIGTFNGICEDRVVFETESWESDGCGPEDEFNSDGLCGVFNGDDNHSGIQQFSRIFLGGGPGTKTYTLDLANGYSITADVTWERVGLNIISGPNRSVCRGDRATLTAVNTNPDYNVVNFRWYSDAGLNTLVFTGNPYQTPNIFADRSYWVTGLLDDGCETNPRKIDITVLDKPVAPQAPAVQTCLNGQALLTARSPISGAIFTWYDDALGNVPLASGPTFLTPPLSAPRSYWVSVQDPAAPCPSNLREVPVTVDLILNAPTAEGVTICEGDEASITANATAGAEVRWYADEELTNLLFIGTTFNVSPSSSTTYYLTQAVNGCTSGSSSVSVTVNPKPDQPGSQEVFTCENVNRVFLNLSPPAGYSVNIYENGVFKINTTSNVPYFFASGQASQTTLEYSYVDIATGCESNKSNYYISPYPSVEAPTAPNVALCAGEEGEIVSNGSSTATAINFYSSDASTLLESDPGNTGKYSVSFATAGVYTYYTSALSANGCESPRMRVDVIVGGGAPSGAPTAEDVTICSGERAILSATGSVGGAMYWYSDESLNNLLFIGNPYETLPLTENTTFYVAEGSGECGASAATAVDVIVNPAASLPFGTADYTICEGQIIPSGMGLTAACSDAVTGGTASSLITGVASFPVLIGSDQGVGGVITFNAAAIPAGATVTNVNVIVNMAHTWAEDVILDLTAPGGVSANILDGNAGNDNFGTGGTTPLTYIFNDVASNFVVGTPGNNDIPSGAYLPNEDFSVFDGSNASGTWTLTVNDGFDGDGGSLTAASINIFYQLPSSAGSLTWWDAASGGTQVGSGSPFVPTGYEALPVGSYTYYAQCGDVGDCAVNRVPVKLNVLPAIASPIINGDDEVCEGQQANLQVTNPGAMVYWYGDDELTMLMGIGATFTTPPLSETTSFYAVNSNGNCTSAAVQYTVTVNEAPTATVFSDPSPSFFSGNIEICEGTIVNLEVQLDDPASQVALLYTEEEPSNLLADWLVVTQDFIEINTMSDMIYYVRVFDQVTGCFSKPVPIYIDVFDKPNDVEVRGDEVCVGEEATIHVDVSTLFDNPEPNAQVNVYLADEGGIIIDAIEIPAGATAYNADFLVGSFDVPGTYNFQVTTDNAYGCFGTPQIVTVVVHDIPNSPRVTGDAVCEGETAMLRAVTEEGVVHWYATETSTDVLQVGGVFTLPNVSLDATYYVSAVNEWGCESFRVPVSVAVNARPEAPEVSQDAETICLGQTVTFTVENANPDLIYVWSSDPMGVDVWAIGEEFETPPLAQYTAFYVTAIDPVTGCASEPTAAWVLVDNTLIISNATSAPVCEGEDAIIQVAVWDVESIVGLFDWELNLLDIAFLPDEDTTNDNAPWVADFVIPDLAAGEYIYYVQEVGMNFFPCGSIPISVLVKVNALPNPPVVGNDTVCEGSAARVVAASTEGIVHWYNSSSSDVVLATGAIFDIPVAISDRTWWVSVVNDNGCESERVPVSLIVNANPETPEFTQDAEVICLGETVTFTVENADPDLVYVWSSDPLMVDIWTVGEEFQSPPLSQSTTYYLTAINPLTGCMSEPVAVYVFVDNTLIISSATSDPVCEGNDAVIKVATWDVVSAVGLFDFDLNLVDVALLPDNDTAIDNSPWVADFSIPDLAAGEYIYYVLEIGQEIFPCGSIPISVLVRVLEGPGKPEAMNDSPTCEGGDVLVSAMAPDANTYAWTGPNDYTNNAQTFILQDVTINQAGDYIVTVFDLNGCSASDTTTVVVNPSPTLGEGQEPDYNDPLCERDTLRLTVGTVEGVTYHWEGPNGFMSDEQNPIIPNVTEADNQGFYMVQLTDVVTQCKSKKYALLVNINKRPDNVVAVNDGPKCAGEDINLSTGSVYGASYQWTGPNQYTAGTRQAVIEDISAEDAGTYSVVVTVDGCSSEPATTEVVVYPNPVADAGPDDTTEHGTPIQLNGSGGITYQWSPNEYMAPSNTLPNPFVNPPVGQNTYTLTVWNEYGCSDQDEVVITVLPTDDIDIPEVITPNGDGNNDTWIIGFLSDLGEYELCIYARDGAQLFCTKKYENDWNGTYKGDKLPDGTYWYVIKTAEKTYKGAVTIRR